MIRRITMLVLAFSVVVATVTPALAGALEDSLDEMARELSTTVPKELKRPLVAFVVDFTGVDSSTGAYRAVVLGGALAQRDEAFTIVDRKRLLDAIREQDFSMSDLSDPDSAKKIGRILSADAIVYGISEMGTKMEALTGWIMMVETTRRFANSYRQYRWAPGASPAVLRSLALPGWGQFYRQRGHSGLAFMGVWSVLAGGTVYSHLEAGNAHDDAVRATTIPDRERLLDRQKKYKNIRLACLVGLGIDYVWSMLDAARVPPIRAEVRGGERATVALKVSF